jgi:hypothetical protein
MFLDFSEMRSFLQNMREFLTMHNLQQRNILESHFLIIISQEPRFLLSLIIRMISYLFVKSKMVKKDTFYDKSKIFIRLVKSSQKKKSIHLFQGLCVTFKKNF